MNNSWRKNLSKMLHDGLGLDSIVKQAVRKALEDHKSRKNPVAVWDGENTVIVQPDDIRVDNKKTDA